MQTRPDVYQISSRFKEDYPATIYLSDNRISSWFESQNQNDQSLIKVRAQRNLFIGQTWCGDLGGYSEGSPWKITQQPPWMFYV